MNVACQLRFKLSIIRKQVHHTTGELQLSHVITRAFEKANEVHHEKTDLKVFVVVISKDGRARPSFF